MHIALLGILCVSCGERPAIEKPEDLIPEDAMEEILYELALIDGVEGQDRELLKKLGNNRSDYIYAKYAIDSLQLAKSNIYYAADPESFAKLYQRIEDRFAALRDTLNTRMKKKNEKTSANKEAKSRVDSVEWIKKN